MALNYSSVDAYLNWLRIFGESNDEFKITKLNEDIQNITAPTQKRFYLKKLSQIKGEPTISSAELSSEYDKTMHFINRLNAFRQKNTSLLNFLLQLYLVASVVENHDVEDIFQKIVFKHMVVFNIFAAALCYARLLTTFLELYHAEDAEERKFILQQRQFNLMTDALAATIHALRIAYMVIKDYQMLPILGVVIFAIDAFVALYELYHTIVKYRQSVSDIAPSLTKFDLSDYHHMSYKTRMDYIKLQFEGCENNQEKMQWLNLLILEQKFQLDFWKKTSNLILCASILVAFIILQQYLVLSIPGVIVSQEFLQCINAFIIYFCYFIRDLWLDHGLPNVLATDTVELEHEGKKLTFKHGKVLQNHAEQSKLEILQSFLTSELFLNMAIISLGIGLFALKLDLLVIFIMLPVIILIKEMLKPQVEEREFDVTDVEFHRHPNG